MLDPQHFLAYVVRPSLESIGLWSEAAERLLLGTAIAESQLTWLRQHGGGPARGVYQIEPATHDDIWANYLAYRDGLANRVARLRMRAGMALFQTTRAFTGIGSLRSSGFSSRSTTAPDSS